MSKVIAVTGGIATGKSTFCKLLSEIDESPVISSDGLVHQLYESDELKALIRERYGSGVFSEGRVDRQELGKLAFGSSVERSWLEGQLHPRVLKGIQGWITEQTVYETVIVEVPLLYEVDFPLKRDFDVVVACSPTTQLHRLQQRNQIDLEHAQARIASQLSINEKIRRANLVIWNEGSHALLVGQTHLASRRIRYLSK